MSECRRFLRFPFVFFSVFTNVVCCNGQNFSCICIIYHHFCRSCLSRKFYCFNVFSVILIVSELRYFVGFSIEFIGKRYYEYFVLFDDGFTIHDLATRCFEICFRHNFLPLNQLFKSPSLMLLSF